MARHKFRKLNVWVDGVKFVSESYKLTKAFPKSEQYNLVSQMNRCATSVPSNIAEGSAKSTDKHFKLYLENSLGSAYEWETQLEIAKSEKYISENSYKEMLSTIQSLQRRIGSFIDKLGT